MKILLLSAYDAVSHRRWCHTLVDAFDEHQWTVLSLPPRYFNWRIRGNSLSWAFGEREVLSEPYDLLIATSMVDLSSLRGFVPSLASVPTLVYFHENQFAYPESQQQFASVEPKIVNLYTALVADKLLFNSAYNRDTFLQGAQRLLSKMPDHVPGGLPERLKQASDVLPVPLSNTDFHLRIRPAEGHLSVLWNHRWEYDKGPERLLSALQYLVKSEQPLELHIVGQQFRQLPEVFTQMKALIDSADHLELKHWGYIKDDLAYQQILQTADVVVSTALHDFQGLAVLEAVAAGCIPLVPDRLCYSEWFDNSFLYHSDEKHPELEAQALAQRLQLLAVSKQQDALPVVPSVEFLSVSELKTDYQQVFNQLVL